MSTGQSPQTPPTPEGVQEVAQRVNIAPPIRKHYKPMGFGVERVTVGDAVEGTERTEYHVNFLVSPFEVIIIEIDEADKKGIVAELTGGVVLP